MELISIAKWLIMCFMVSCLMRPFLRLKNLKLWDGGFSVSLSLGTALSFFVSWIISAITPAKFDTETAYVSLLGLSVISLILTGLKKRKNIASDNINASGNMKTLPIQFPKKGQKIQRDTHENREHKKNFLLGFALFTVLFLIAVWVKGFKPEISNDTEKFMDYGFMQTIYRQKSAIPEDLWFSGKTLNYYFLGQSAAVYLCRLAFITPEYGYNFMLCTIFALSFCMILSIVDAFLRSGYLTAKSHAKLGGAIAASLACLGGNGHYLIFGFFAPILEKITGRTFRYNDYGYFFPDSTTYIGMYPETMDKGKHEFLAYTLVLGDLHAHAINVIFVLLLITMLLDYALDEKNVTDPDERVAEELAKINNLSYLILDKIRDICCDYRIIVIGILLGLYRGTNYWDFPIYFIVAGAVILFTDYRREGISLRCTIRVLIKGAYIFLMGTILILPFSLHFEKMASKICLAENRSPLYKLLILWGIPVALCLIFLIHTHVFRRGFHEIPEDKITKVTLSDLTMHALILCAIGLVILPEVIYVKDIYGDEYARFNTMFKLTYQAFTLFAISMGVATGVWMDRGKKVLGNITLVISILLSTYIFVAVYQFMGNVFIPSERIGTSAVDPLYDDASLSAEATAIGIINADDSENIHIMEKYGKSYSPDCRISVFTGACNVAGWEVHEWMWRNNWDIVAEREGEIGYFYVGGDSDYCKSIIDKYDIDYIFAGPREWSEYTVNADGFSKFCEKIPVSEDLTVALYKVIK